MQGAPNIDPGGFAPADPPTTSLAGRFVGPLRSVGLTSLRSFARTTGAFASLGAVRDGRHRAHHDTDRAHVAPIASLVRDLTDGDPAWFGRASTPAERPSLRSGAISRTET